VRVADRVTPWYEPEIATFVEKSTGSVLTVNLALEAPAGMVTLDGTLAANVLLLESETTAPPDGAGPLSVTVPVDEPRPITLDGLRVSDTSVGGRTMSVAVLVMPL